jgi:predicted metal-dependent phosphoesterase TrpH
MMVDKGYVPTLREAFYQYLGEDMPAYVYKSDIPVTAAIEIINKSGGVAVLAHPANWFKPAFLFKLIESGLDGIEVYHPSHNQNLVKHYKSIASQFWLLETGGSDFHGNREYDEMNLGKFGISEKQLETILNHHK